MAKALQVGDRVYVPRSRIGLDSNSPSAFHFTTVTAVNARKVDVGVPGGGTVAVASSAVHRNIGLLIFRIGDYDTELSLLNPLAKSLLQFFRLLLPDDMIVMRDVRTRQELEHWWVKDHGAYSHVVVVGHGRDDGVRFGDADWIDGSEFMKIMEKPNPDPKTFVSLCCETGYAAFAKVVSSSKVCTALIAPFHTVHGAVACQFTQSYFAYHLLDGNSCKVAFNHATTAIPGGIHFRLWQSGEIVAGK